MRVLILAGGFATRLWPITLFWPKPLLPVAGVPIIDYILQLVPEELLPVAVNTNRRFAQDFSAWAKGKPVELVVEEVRSEEEKLGAVGSLAHLVQKLDLKEDLLVIGGDNLMDLDLRGFLAASEGHPCVALYDLGDPRRAARRYGVAVVEGGWIVEFQEKPKNPNSTLVSTACYFFPKEVVPLLSAYLAQAPAGKDAPGYFLAWLSRRFPLRAYTEVREWLDIGDRASYIEANMRRTAGQSWVSPQAEVVSCELTRCVVLGPAVLKNSKIFECVVDGETKVEGVELREALIGRGTYLRGDLS